MTREEAISIFMSADWGWLNEEEKEAFRMAIEALSMQYTDIVQITDDRPKGLYHGTLDVQSGVLTVDKADGDLISRADAVEAVRKAYFDKDIQSAKDDPCIVDAMTVWAIRQIKALPSADAVSREEYHKLLRDKISFANATVPSAEADRPHGRLIDADALYKNATDLWDKSDGEDFDKGIFKLIFNAPTIADRPHGECRTCGRNADNGVVHEDGRTKCPIQEHYALPLDGYCHLYEPYKGGDAE